MFWKKQENKAGTNALVALTELHTADWESVTPARMLEAGFRQNPISYRCIRLIAETAASVPILAIEETPNAMAGQLKNLLTAPTPGETGQSLLEAVYGDLQVSGNAFLELVAGADDFPVFLRRVPPRAIEPMKDASGVLIRTRNGHRQISADANGWMPVLHLRALDPGPARLAMSPLKAASRAVDIHNAGGNWAKALIDNAARPSGALIYGKDGANLTPDQFQRLKDQLQEAHAGARNAGRPMLLEGGLDWKPMGLTPADMDFIEARRESAREIALAFGVPPMLLGIPGDNTYANYKEANLAFWRLTVLPLVQRTIRALEAWFDGAGASGLRLKADLDAVPALAPEREALWRRLAAADFLTEDEKRSIAGLSPVERPQSREANHAD